jgi:hypothetical protein
MKPYAVLKQELLTEILDSGISSVMGEQSAQSLEQAIEQEEVRLRERLAKIAMFKQLARELNIPVSAAAPSASAELPPAALPKPEAELFDGTFASLILCYQVHKDSPYHQLKHDVRIGYANTFKRLKKDVGNERVADWSAQRVKAAYDEIWAANGKIAMGRGIVAKLRLLMSFGSTVLNDDGCTRLSAILSNMRFPVARGGSEPLTIENVRAIRATARGHFGWDSIALAQALQFELPQLRQIDVIGQWVPLSEPGPPSEIVKGNEKWVHGLRWSDIDDDMILRRVLTSGRSNHQREVEFKLRRSVMVMEEINRVPKEKRKGPMIVCEYTNRPWSAAEFRRKWRIVANKAGVPLSIKNSAPSAEDEDSEVMADRNGKPL